MREREFLSAIVTCMAAWLHGYMKYMNILLGYPIIVFTDHKNNTFNGLKASECGFALVFTP
jgi:hypothetical protein